MVGSARPAHAQLGDVGVRFHAGIVQPLGTFGDYFELGPSFALDLGYPLNQRMDLKLDLDMDWINTTDVHPTPVSNLWRYRLGFETDLFGDEGASGPVLKAHVGAGGTTVRSKKFWLESRQPYTFAGETLNQTSLSASGGLRLGVHTPDGITWWLTGKLSWTPIEDTHQDALQELARNELDPLGSALSAAITIGVTLW
jgi:hypothetical protein